MDAQFGSFAQCPLHGIKKMGPIIPSQVGDMSPEDAMFPMAVIGQFLDYRNFSANQIQNWINTFWVTNGEIKVERIGKIFFFIVRIMMIEITYYPGKVQTIKVHS